MNATANASAHNYSDWAPLFLDTAGSGGLSCWLLFFGFVLCKKCPLRLDEADMIVRSWFAEKRWLAIGTHFLMTVLFPAVSALFSVPWASGSGQFDGYYLCRALLQFTLWATAARILHENTLEENLTEKELSEPLQVDCDAEEKDDGDFLVTCANSAPTTITTNSDDAKKTEEIVPSTSAAPRDTGWLLRCFYQTSFFERCLLIASMDVFNGEWWQNIDRREFGAVQHLFVYLEFTALAVVCLCELEALVHYGDDDDDADEEDDEPDKERKKTRNTWREWWRNTQVVLPYVWPKDNRLPQALLIGCLVMMLLERILNVLDPLFSKWIADSLAKLEFRWDLIAGLALSNILFRMCDHLKGLCWYRVRNSVARQVQVSLYEHLLNLSLRFHIGRKTGKVLRVMDRGGESVSQVFEAIAFDTLPTIIDLVFAAVLLAQLNKWFIFVIAISSVFGTFVKAVTADYRKRMVTKLIAAEGQFQQNAIDSLLNFETVKYYNAEDYEIDRYRSALIASQESSLWDTIMSACLYFLETVADSGATMAGSLLCAYLISKGSDGLTVGDYALFAVHQMQLTAPISNMFFTYNYIKMAFLQMQDMLDMMEEKPEVPDHPNAEPFRFLEGKIEFRNVSFEYHEGQPILQDVSFVVAPGKTLAVVGPSGSGKSTIVRLLFRFYKPAAGQIFFDDQNVDFLQQKSLRQHIGVVPQDTVLFNDTIRYNIRYGNSKASDEQVESAAKAADVHDNIMKFPEGYQSRVGERGLKLSGGEKQRVAIARTLLKGPTFVLLDEATSALDTHSERNIQDSLRSVCVGRTCVVVAHRLSTIVHADEIIVLKDGRVAERGTHTDLLAHGGIYHEMWLLQQGERPEELKKKKTSLAKRLRANENFRLLYDDICRRNKGGGQAGLAARSLSHYASSTDVDPVIAAAVAKRQRLLSLHSLGFSGKL